MAIINSWSLIEFARANGKMKVVPEHTSVNANGETFTASSVAFVHPTEKDSQGRSKVVFAGFSNKLGALTPAEIVAMADQLQICQLESGNYNLCKAGESSWADVDLAI